MHLPSTLLVTKPELKVCGKGSELHLLQLLPRKKLAHWKYITPGISDREKFHVQNKCTLLNSVLS